MTTQSGEDRASKLWVYIASPYTKGDVAINVRYQLSVWDRLLDLGVVPIAPLYSHFQHLFCPRPYTDWIEHDLDLLQRCDVLLRLTATHEGAVNYEQHESSGADGEVAEFQRLGRPVFYSIEAFVDWLNSRTS